MINITGHSLMHTFTLIEKKQKEKRKREGTALQRSGLLGLDD